MEGQSDASSVHGAKVGEKEPESLQFDTASRLQLIRFLSELNPDDSTTHDDFFLEFVRQFNGNTMLELTTEYISKKGEKLLKMPLVGIRSRSFQLELFHRFALLAMNQLVYLPSGTGKNVLACTAMKYMLQQYSNKKVIFVGPSAVSVTLQGLEYLERTSSPLSSIGIFHSPNCRKKYPLQQVEAIFTTPEMLLTLISSKEVFLHHCSLLVVDEFQETIVNPNFAQFTMLHWSTELVQYLPRLMGLMSTPTLPLLLGPWLAYIAQLAPAWRAEYCIPFDLDSLSELRSISWLGEPKFEKCDISASYASLVLSISQYIRKAVGILIHTHRDQQAAAQLASQQNRALRPSSSTSPLAEPSTNSSWHDELMEQLIVLAELVEGGEYDFSIYSRIATRFARVMSDLSQSTTTKFSKMVIDDIRKAWNVSEELEILGFSLARPSLVALVEPLQDSPPQPNQRQSMFHINHAKDSLRQTFPSQAEGSGKTQPLVSALLKLQPKSRAVVVVQQASTADKVAEFLQSQLSEEFGVLSLNGNFDAVIADYQSGKCRVLVSPLLLEKSDVNFSIQADLLIRLDSINDCQSLIQNPTLSRSLLSDEPFMIIARSDEVEALEIKAAKEALIFASLRAQCDPIGAERDSVDVQQLEARYQRLESQRTTSNFNQREPSQTQGFDRLRSAIGQGRTHSQDNGNGGYQGGMQYGISAPSPLNQHPSSPNPSASMAHGVYNGSWQQMAPVAASSRAPESSQMMQSIHAMAPSHSPSAGWPQAQGIATPSYAPPHMVTNALSVYGGNAMQMSGMGPNGGSQGGFGAFPSMQGQSQHKVSAKAASNPIGYLQEHFQKRGSPIPVYTEISGVHGGNEFVVECAVAGQREHGKASTKKQAKTESALAMLRRFGL
jgi:hypothetical protein